MGYSKPYLPLGITNLQKNTARTGKQGLPEVLFLWELPYYHLRQLPKNISLEKFLNNIQMGVPSYTHGELQSEKPVFGGFYNPHEPYAVKISPNWIEVSSRSENIGEQIAQMFISVANKSLL